MPKLENVPDLGNLPENTYLFRIDELELTVSKKGYLQYVGHLRAEEPKEFIEVPATDFFTIGTADDPEGSKDDTWIKSYGARRMKAFAVAAQVPMEDDDDVFCASLVGQKVIGDLKVTTDNDPNSEYFGRDNRQITYFQLGQKMPSRSGAAPGAKLPPGRPAAAAKAPTAPAARPVAPAARPAAPLAPKAPVAARPPAPAARPAAPAAPAKPGRKPAAPAAPVAAAAAAAVEWYLCEECKGTCEAEGRDPNLAFDEGGAMVVKSLFRDHIINAHAD